MLALGDKSKLLTEEEIEKLRTSMDIEVDMLFNLWNTGVQILHE